MKYKTIIETDEFEDFEFFEDGNGKYIHGIDAGAVDNEWIVLYFTECEQESILDKIRAEIKESRDIQNVPYDVDYYSYVDGVNKCLGIIDKYKAESEETE